MYLTDDDLIKALKDSVAHLTISETTGQSGLIIIKENVKAAGVYLDKEDNSLIRSPLHFKAIFEAAGLEILHASYQPGWPKDLFEIMMWVLRKKPSETPAVEESNEEEQKTE